MINFDNTYEKLPQSFYAKAQPDKVSKPTLLAYNQELGKKLGLDLEALSEHQLAALFSGQLLPDHASCIALAYAGHQFGHFSPQLGDGRALLLGEIITPQGNRYDIQYKGSGPTPFSRNGDGKSSLGPVIREYIVSEAMHFLGVPTTRALAAVTTGDAVFREQALPGGIFTRVAASHLRVGTFEYFAGQADLESLKILVDYAIDRHYPELKNQEERHLGFLQAVANAHIQMVTSWLSFGFIHGVMNTDNMSISGETIDYGPCAFMDNFSANKVFSSIDHNGRYAYSNQISIAIWNLCRLASCLIPFVHADQKRAISIIEEAINSYSHRYEQQWLTVMGKKLGFFSVKEEDKALINHWLQYLEEEALDFTLSFQKLGESSSYFPETARYKDFFAMWQKRLDNQPQDRQAAKDLMQQANPVFIPRNHQVERAIQAAYRGDLSIFNEMNQLLKKPYSDQPAYQAYTVPPKPEERVKATFCGT